MQQHIAICRNRDTSGVMDNREKRSKSSTRWAKKHIRVFRIESYSNYRCIVCRWQTFSATLMRPRDVYFCQNGVHGFFLHGARVYRTHLQFIYIRHECETEER